IVTVKPESEAVGLRAMLSMLNDNARGGHASWLQERLRTGGRSLAQQEDHLFSVVVQGSFLERTEFRHWLETGKQKQRPQMRIGEIGKLESFCFLKNELAGAKCSVD